MTAQGKESNFVSHPTHPGIGCSPGRGPLSGAAGSQGSCHRWLLPAVRSLPCRRPCGTLGRSCGDDQKRQRRRCQRCFIILFGCADSAGRDAAAAIGRLPAPCRLRSHMSTKQERIKQSDEPAWQRSHARSAGLDSCFGIAQAMEEVAQQPVCNRGCSRC